MQKEHILKQIFKHDQAFILIVIAVNILIGLFIVGDYGVSVDEPLSWAFGTRALEQFVSDSESIHVDYSHGGGFLIPAKISSLLLTMLFQNWPEPYSWHFSYFLVFMLSVYLIFILARKLLGVWGANFAALLYMTQPMLWGHAFMNPKDVPFMAIFMGAIVLGISLTDQMAKAEWNSAEIRKELREGLSADRKNFSFRPVLIGILLLWGFVVFIWLGKDILHGWIESAITAIYTAPADSLGGRLFSSLAANAEGIALTNYINKSLLIFDRTIIRIKTLLLILSAVSSVYFILPKVSLAAFNFLKKLGRIPFFFPAAILLGVCAATRTFGIFAFVVVILYWAIKNRAKSISVLLICLAFAVIISFLLWPDLWAAPASTFGDYMRNVFGFEKWNGKILFEGTLYNKENYPNHMLPKLLALQLTEPVLFLTVSGIVVALIRTWQRKADWILVGLLAGWGLAPILLGVVLHPVIYNGFRHFFFILPPFFIFAGFAIEAIFSKINIPVWRAAIILLLLLPGILGIVQLHPYEYVYFNSFTGGVSGAYRVYELDYWRIANKEAVEYLNEIAPPNSIVSVHGGWDTLTWYARPDYQQLGLIQKVESEKIDYVIDYVIISTNLTLDQELEIYFPNVEKIHSIDRDGVPLVIIYKFNP